VHKGYISDCLIIATCPLRRLARLPSAITVRQATFLTDHVRFPAFTHFDTQVNTSADLPKISGETRLAGHRFRTGHPRLQFNRLDIGRNFEPPTGGLSTCLRLFRMAQMTAYSDNACRLYCPPDYPWIVSPLKSPMAAPDPRLGCCRRPNVLRYILA
jgi:hypothetical protein